MQSMEDTRIYNSSIDVLPKDFLYGSHLQSLPVMHNSGYVLILIPIPAF